MGIFLKNKGIVKLPVFNTTAIEGYYYRPNTTALEAQRIGIGGFSLRISAAWMHLLQWWLTPKPS
jgi:hypothetical protein